MTRGRLPAAWFAMAVAAGSILGRAAAAGNDELEDLLADFHGRYGIPRATAAIAFPGGEVVTAATGLADVEAGLAMAPDTPMLAGSIGKTFVAATVLALESDGLLSRDDPVRITSAAGTGSRGSRTTRR